MSTQRRPNLVLTGLTAVGKSAVANRIATLSGREFVDLGTELVARHGNFYELSDDERREVEQKLVSELVPKRNLVIATTSTTMLDQDNVVSLLGTETFHLTASTAEIAKRAQLEAITMHPELADADDIEGRIESMRGERSEVYERFTTVDTTGMSVDKVIDALRKAGADIFDPTTESEAATSADRMDERTQRIFIYVIAAALAVLVVLVVLVLTF